GFAAVAHAAVARRPADWVHVAHVSEHCVTHEFSVRVQLVRQLLVEHRDAHCCSVCGQFVPYVWADAMQVGEAVHAPASDASAEGPASPARASPLSPAPVSPASGIVASRTAPSSSAWGVASSAPTRPAPSAGPASGRGAAASADTGAKRSKSRAQAASPRLASAPPATG